MEEHSLAFEMLAELKNHARRWFIISIIELVIIILTNVAWFVYNSQFEIIDEEQIITQEQVETENSSMRGVIN